MPNNGKTLHQKLDEVIEITTVIRIEQGRVGVRLDNAKEERREMKIDIKENAKTKRISNIWDGVNSLLIGIGTYLGMKY